MRGTRSEADEGVVEPKVLHSLSSNTESASVGALDARRRDAGDAGTSLRSANEADGAPPPRALCANLANGLKKSRRPNERNEADGPQSASAAERVREMRARIACVSLADHGRRRGVAPGGAGTEDRLPVQQH